MGQSTNALLYFGFTFHNSEDGDDPPWGDWADPDDDCFDVEEWLCEKLGGPHSPAGEWSGGTKDQWHKYWNAKTEFLKRAAVKVDNHCSCDCPIYFVCVNGSGHLAYRGSPERLPDLVEGPWWKRALRDGCERLGIPWQEPAWELASLLC